MVLASCLLGIRQARGQHHKPRGERVRNIRDEGPYDRHSDIPLSAELRALPRGRSPRLLDPLRIVASRARFLAFFRAAFKFIVLAAITWLITVLILGSRIQVPAWLAVPLVVIAWGIVLIGGIRLFRPVFRRHNLTSAAHLVDIALPDTQERISSAVELTLEKDPDFRGSPELIACLIRQAEHHADCMNPTAVVSGRDVFRWFTGAIALFLVWFVLLVLMTPNVLLGLRRTFAPWSAAAPLATSILEVTPGDLTLAQGQSLDIKVLVKPPPGLSLDTGLEKIAAATLHQHFTAKSAGLPIPDRDIALVPLDNRSFHLAFDGTQQPLAQQSFTYQITIDGGKDIGQTQSPPYTITVQARPGIASMQLTYTFPAYTQLAPRTEPSPEGIIDALVDTKVRLTLKTTQAVKIAQLTIDDNGSGTATIPLLLPVPGEANPPFAHRRIYPRQIHPIPYHPRHRRRPRQSRFPGSPHHRPPRHSTAYRHRQPRHAADRSPRRHRSRPLPRRRRLWPFQNRSPHPGR